MEKIKGNEDLFESLEEFVDNLSRGGEIELVYETENYSITHANGNLCFIKVGDPSTFKEFKSIDELLMHELSGEMIKQVVTEIQPYFRCF